MDCIRHSCHSFLLEIYVLLGIFLVFFILIFSCDEAGASSGLLADPMPLHKHYLWV
jgi:hypothetical protein